MTDVLYTQDYPGIYSMQAHDAQDQLKRWFDNYKVDRYASFASQYEWLVVKTEGKRVFCEIGDDGRGTVRTVEIDLNAPPAPILTYAAKERYVPPPPKTAAEIRRDEEWSQLYRMGYVPFRSVPKPRREPVRMIQRPKNGLSWLDMDLNEPMEYETVPDPRGAPPRHGTFTDDPNRPGYELEWRLERDRYSTISEFIRAEAPLPTQRYARNQ